MSTLSEIGETEASELVRLMKEACSGSPVMTPEGAGIMLNVLIKEMGKLLQQSEGAASVEKEWGTALEIGKIYGFHRETMRKHLVAWASAGKVRVRRIFDEVTHAYGNKLYSLADVDALMEKAADEAADKERKERKGAA